MPTMPPTKKTWQHEVKGMRTLAKLGEDILKLVEANPKATQAYRDLWGGERHVNDIVQAAITQACIARGEDGP